MYILLFIYSQRFRERAHLFTKFVQYLSSIKIRYGGYPENVKTRKQKLKYCEKINAEMGFNHPSLKLSPNDIEINEIKKQCAKDALNSEYGTY